MTDQKPVKLTAKQEAFCLAILTEPDQASAYRSAYKPQKMSANAIYREASVMMKIPKIAQRVTELRAARADKAVMKKSEWDQLLTKMARADVGKMFDSFGNPKEIRELGENERAIIEGFEFIEDFAGKEGERTAVGYTKKFKMTPKLAVLKELGEALGYYHDPKRPPALGTGENPVRHVHLHFAEPTKQIEHGPTKKQPVFVGSGNGR